MARVVVIDPDLRIRSALARLLKTAGHLVTELTDVEELDAQLEDAALVFAAAGPGGSLIDSTASQLHLRGNRQRVIWTGPLAATIQPAVDAGVGSDVLELPTSLPALTGLLTRHLARHAGDAWNGEGFLRRVDGLDERFPPLRVLFLAHRLNQSGSLRVGDAEIDLQQGKIADVRGISEGELAGGLMQAIGAAISKGQTPDAAMQAAGVDALVGLLRMSEASTGELPVQFTFKNIRAPVVLATRMPRLLGLALERIRPPGVVRRELGGEPDRVVSLHPPEDSPERMWGLSPVALRTVRSGRSARNLGELLAAAGGADREAAWSAIDFLGKLGIVRFDEEAVVASSGEGAVDFRDDIVIEAVQLEPEPTEDPQVVALKEALAELESQSPWELFGLDDPVEVTLDGVTQRFREASAEHHPDRFIGSSEEVRSAAAACFAAWGNARDRFADEAFRDEVRARLIARRDGRVYVSESDEKRAKLAYSKGQYHARRQDWTEALASFEESLELNPTDWETQFQVVLARWKSGAIDASTAAGALDEVTAPTMRGRAELRFQVGEARLAAGNEEGAFAAFEEAVKAVPGHVGASRRLRLRSMRQERAEGEQKGGLRGLFKWGRKED